MRMKPRRGSVISLLALAAAACSGPDSGPEAANDANSVSEAVQPNVVEPDVPDPVINETVQALPCPATPGSMCAGPLIVRAENINLLASGGARDDGSRNLNARGNLVFENRTAAPVRIAILNLPTDILFGNGIQLGVTRNGITGVFLCGRDGAECFQGMPDRFQTLAPGDSPARANISFDGRMDGSLAASLPSVSSATITLQVYVVDAGNSGIVLNLSLPNVPVQNQLRQ